MAPPGPVSVFHPAFTGLGGAEALALSQARYLAAHGFAVQVVTYACEAWSFRAELASLPVCVAQPRLFRSRVPNTSEAWAIRFAEQSFQTASIVIAHNFPCNAILSRARYSGQRLWFCHEPPRGLHPVQAQPFLAESLRARAHLESVPLRRFRRQVLRARVHRALRLRLFRYAREDARAVDRMDGIWANSEFTRDNVIRTYGAREIDVVYPMIDAPGPLAARRGIERDALCVLSQSRLHAHKNVETVLRGFAGFRRLHSGARLEVVGRGPELGRLRALAAELGVTDAVTFHGQLPKPRLEALISRCDVFALLPVDEPFGMVFPEAAMRGLLLIGPDHGGPLEILDGGTLGFGVPALSVEGMTDALERILHLSDSEVDEKRRRADDACRSRYGVSVVGAHMIRLLGRRQSA